MKKPKPSEGNEHEQYQLFDTPEYTYRVFVTDMKDPVEMLVWFYNQRAGAENLIKEANNDAGLAAHPSGRWTMNFTAAAAAPTVDYSGLMFALFPLLPGRPREQETIGQARLTDPQLDYASPRNALIRARSYFPGARYCSLISRA